ncbi:MAG: PssE/Cps14G family polysaccharide biosynthesis glycosyltransferase [Acetobacterium sp.]|uniref:PssE/Cps14G family polysaccharide biosynthesis glycosyltransferase n=1 Tax=Acetobacterium sp. TaxID=1872094 RepID=UPI003242F598
MIFVTLGSQRFQFNRLLKKIDECVADGTISDEVFAQIGVSDYIPQHYIYKSFLDRNEFACTISKCDTVITHGGTGAIIGAVKKRKKVIAVPRLARYGEHVDDHQIQLIRQFDGLNLICPCWDVEDLKAAIQTSKMEQYQEYESNSNIIIESIVQFIENN